MYSAVSVSVVTSLAMFLLAAFSVHVMADLSWTATGLGLAVASYFAAQAVTATAVGAWVDFVGWIPGLRLGLLCGFLALTSIAVFGGSPVGVVVGMAIAGFGTASAVTASNRAVLDVIPKSTRAAVFGAKQASVPAAAMLAGLSVPLFSEIVGWRWVFAGAAVIPLVVWPVVPRRTLVGNHARSDKRTITAEEGSKRLVLGLLTVAGMLATSAASSLAAFIVISSVKVGMSPAAAAVLLTAGSTLGVAARVGSGLYVDRSGASDIRMFSLMVLIGAVGILGLALRIEWIIPVAASIAFAAGWGWPGLLHLAVVSRSQGSPGRASGRLATGITIGAALGPAAFGWIADYSSFTLAWLGAGLTALCGGLVASRARVLDR